MRLKYLILFFAVGKALLWNYYSSRADMETSSSKNSVEVQAFFEAANNGDLKGVKKYVKNPKNDVNVINLDVVGYTALMLAAYNGHESVVDILLEKGADVNLVAEDGMTALMNAAMAGHANIVKKLLSKNNKVTDAYQKDGITALKYAANDGYANVAELLLDAGANPDFVINQFVNGQEGMTALMIAANNGRVDVVDTLLKHGAQVEYVDLNDGLTALICAARNGHGSIVDRLVKKGPKMVNVPDKSGLTPLMYGAKNGYPEVVKILLRNGAHRGIKALSGLTRYDEDMTGKTDLELALMGQKHAPSDQKKNYAAVIKLLSN